MFGLLIVYCSKGFLPSSEPKLPRSPRDVYFWWYICGWVRGSEGWPFSSVCWWWRGGGDRDHGRYGCQAEVLKAIVSWHPVCHSWTLSSRRKTTTQSFLKVQPVDFSRHHQFSLSSGGCAAQSICIMSSVELCWVWENNFRDISLSHVGVG